MNDTLKALIAKVKEIKIEPDCVIYTKDNTIFLKFPNSRQFRLAKFTESRIDVPYAEFALYRCNRMNELNGNNNRHEKNVYFCQFCQCFHLTHKDKYPTWNQYRKHKKR